MSRSDVFYQRSRAAFDQKAWAQAISYAGQVLAHEPTHGGALNLMISARQQLDRATEAVGERRVLTVMMIDLVGSTRLTQQLGPEEYREVLLELHTICVNAITAYEGRVAQYLGDGILAYFSYPEAHEDDAERAVRAGLQIVDELDERATDFRALFGVDVQVRIGIDTGLVVVGAMGAGQWTTSDAIVGDAPNLASRIQQLAGPNRVVLSDGTRRLVGDRMRVMTAEAQTVKGVDDPVVVHQAVAMVEGDGAGAGRPGHLVGRDDEVALLAERWAAVLEGGRRSIALVGEAGIGKSRLAEHLVNLAHASGGRSIGLSCTSMRQHVPFHPIANALRRLLALDPQVAATPDVVYERLSVIAPEGLDLEEAAQTIAGLVGGAWSLELLPEQVRDRSLSLLVQLVGLIATSTRLLLVIEDLHHADPSTLELLERLIAASDHPLCIVVTARPDTVPLNEAFEKVPVAPLDAEASDLLVRALLTDAGEEQIRDIIRRADGIPLFLEELAHWTAEGAGTTIPTKLSGVLTARLDALAPDVRDVASVASVIGAEVDYDVLASVTTLTRDELDRRLAELVGRRVLVREPDPKVPDYRFRHALVREAAYDRQVRATRRNLHRRCAEVVAADQADRTGSSAIVASHYEFGDEPLDALVWWGKAAGEAGATGANLEAVDQYRRALRFIDAVPNAAARSMTELGLQLGLGLSCSMTTGYSSDAALLAFERADQLGALLPPAVESAAAIWGLWSFFIVRGELDRADEQVRRALGFAETLGAQGLADTAAAMGGYVRFFQGRLEEATPLLEQGMRSRESLLPNDPRVVSMALLGVIEWMRGDRDRSTQTFAAAFDEARGLEGGRGAFTVAFISAYWAWLAQLSGDSAAAASRAQETIDVATAHSFLTWQGAGYLHLTSALCGLGMLDQGVAGLEATLQAWRKAGAELMVPYFLGQLASAKLAAGATAEALAIVDEALVTAETTGEHLYDAELVRLRAQVLRGAGAPDQEVVDELARAVRTASDQGNRVFVVRAMADLAERGVSEVAVNDSMLSMSDVAAWWTGRAGPPELASWNPPAGTDLGRPFDAAATG